MNFRRKMRRKKIWMVVKMALLLLLPQKMNSRKVIYTHGVKTLSYIDSHTTQAEL